MNLKASGDAMSSAGGLQRSTGHDWNAFRPLLGGLKSKEVAHKLRRLVRGSERHFQFSTFAPNPQISLSIEFCILGIAWNGYPEDIKAHP